jgi:prepilin-type N-terminal cleavage/methylation domain-containing protein
MKENGFTLIEIIVAIGLAALILPALIIVFSFSIQSAGQGENFTKAYALAQKEMETMYHLKDQGGVVWNWITTPINSVTTTPLAGGFTQKVGISDAHLYGSADGTTRKIIVNISWLEKGQNQEVKLIELLVAIGIIGIISVISTQLLWNTVTTRAKQESIEVSSENFRSFIKYLTNSIQEAKSINISNSSTIEIKGTVCRTIHLDAHKIKEAQNTAANCTPPVPLASDLPITPVGVDITTFTFSPTGLQPNNVTITIIGKYIDSMGEHPINFVTSVTPRITI